MKNKKLRRLFDYLLDTLVTNIIIMSIVVPYYIVTGMPWESVKLVIFAFFTIGWVEAFPIPIVLRWVRRKIPYLEVS
jgi:hypothetical protein